MNIIGRGFIAKHFQKLTDQHPNVVLFASGVSQSSITDDKEFQREAAMLYSAIHYCSSNNQLLIYISTSSDHIYTGTTTSGREDEAVFPLSTYGRHKIAMESVIKESGINYLILRLAYPIGPHQKPYQLIPALIQQVSNGYISIRRGTRRDLIDIDDVVELTSRLLEKNVQNEIVNMASGIAVEVEDIARFLEQRVDHIVLKHYTHGQPGYQVNIDKLAMLLGPQSLPFDSHYYKRVIEKYY